MLVYDITNMNSFRMLQKWNHTIEEVSNIIINFNDNVIYL